MSDSLRCAAARSWAITPSSSPERANAWCSRIRPRIGRSSPMARSRRRVGRMAASPGSIRWPTCWASRTEPPTEHGGNRTSIGCAHLGAGEIELYRLLGLAGVDVDGERHAGRGLEKDRLVLDAVWPEDEMGEGLVRHHRLAAMRGLGHIDGCCRVFGRGVLVALEGEIDQEGRRSVA